MNLNKELPEVVITPSRFRNPIGKYRLHRTNECTGCGQCVEICPYGVHVKIGRVLTKNHYRCIGPECPNACFEACPAGALSLKRNPTFDTMGDLRWTPDLLVSTWCMAETGDVPQGGLEYRIGDSNGGFDRLRLVFPRFHRTNSSPLNEEVDLGIELNRRDNSSHRIRIEVPFYGAGMSYGSVSITTMLSRVRAATALSTFSCTGEGGYPDQLKPYDDHVITQVATGLFGVREETIKRVRIVEFKYAQGAFPLPLSQCIFCGGPQETC